MSETSSSEKPEVCWPSRSASTTVCVAVRKSQSVSQPANQEHMHNQRNGKERTLSRLRIPA